MTIRTKLLAAIASPLILVAILAGNTIYQSWQTASEMDGIRELTAFSSTVSSLVHETQKERGATAGFLGNPDGNFATRLQKQRELTNQRLADFNALLADFDPSAYGTEFAEQVRAANHEISLLEDKRRKISANDLPAGAAIGFYTNLNGLLLDAVGKTSLVTNDGSISVRINAYAAFLKSKERAGIERAVLANTFAADKFGPKMYEKFITLVALQDSYISEFLTIANEDDRQFYETTLQTPVVEQVNEYRAAAIAHAATGGFDKDSGEWFDTITKKINLLKKVDDHLASGLAQHAAQAAQHANTLLLTILLSTLATGLLVTLGGWYAISSVTNRLATVTERVRDIAEGDADLTARLDIQTDEIGDLSRWFNVMLDRFESIMVSIATTSTELANSADQLVDTADSLKTGTDDSKSQSSTISAAVEQMSTNMGQTAAAAEEMSNGIAGVSESLDSIRKSIEEVSNRTHKSASIAQSATECVETGNGQINQLGDAAREIGDVIDVIQDIAEQTNLLALNATIEAARAGEAGKGFAVVATEVKELASQTAKATDGIRDRVLAMQNCAEQTVVAMQNIDEVIQNVNAASDSIASAVAQQTDSVSSISSTMQLSSQASQQIAGGINESALASQEITRSVTVVDTALRGTADGADQTHTTGTYVAKLASELQEQVSQFKTRQ